ncbi:hypothetical protein K353_00982 [Kitasatospora sp. SolWspMP-SS2h]|uniref:DUF6328 family protein n=1 Tax=Kitasatospora sp. SolWspMP-SS2h TaxID=1305729 RepID=UPI000DB957DA|nr:DUF6328 family protein [Kitasatospora sp. SolWspMP-SS2h]RAJ45484.1 hypothetical protein K353_00982 [Kitasatospora sp. SolWspMP-SS2h]
MSDASTPGGGPGRDESPQERADRQWDEMLQEVRVAQTGAQILFGFLLSVAFTPRFATLGDFDRNLYTATVILGACATASLIAPVAFHRLLAGHDLKPVLIRTGSRLLGLGLTLLALTIGCALLLLLRTATGNAVLAAVVSAAGLAYFALTWLVLPSLLLRHEERRAGGRRAGR